MAFRRAPALIVLWLVLLGFATIADAATCGPEAGFAEVVEVARAEVALEAPGDTHERSDSDGSPIQHGGCTHGHCHHGSTTTDGVRTGERLSAISVPVPLAQSYLHPVDREILSPPPKA